MPEPQPLTAASAELALPAGRAAEAGPSSSWRPPDSPAESVFRRLVMYIRAFEEQLDADHEIGGRMVSFGPAVQFHIVDMGYWGPDIITFDGVDDSGSRMKLIQNISQLNVLLVALPKQQPEAEPRRIGFILSTSGATNTAPKSG